MNNNSKYAVITTSGDYTKEGERVLIQWFESLTVAYKYWLVNDPTHSKIIKVIDPTISE